MSVSLLDVRQCERMFLLLLLNYNHTTIGDVEALSQSLDVVIAAHELSLQVVNACGSLGFDAGERSDGSGIMIAVSLPVCPYFFPFPAYILT